MNCKQCDAPIPSALPGDKCFYCGKDPTIAASATHMGASSAPTAGRPSAGAGSSGAGTKVLPLIVVLMVGSVVMWFLMNDSPKPQVRPLPSVAVEDRPMLEASAAIPPPRWKGDEPLACAGDERHTLKGATIAGNGRLIHASGNCQVTLESCTIAGRTMDVQEGATLTITGGRLENTSLSARGQSRLALKGVDLQRNTSGLRLQEEAQGSIEGGTVAAVHSPAVRLDDQARLFLRKVAVTGGVEARDESVIHVQSGSLSLPEPSEPDSMMDEMRGRMSAAIRVYDTAVVALQDVTVTGPIKKLGGAVIALQPGDDAAAIIKASREQAVRLERYERKACQGFVGCYIDHGSNGKVDVHVVMPIGSDGKTVGARVRRAVGANPKTRACLQKAAGERVIDGFDGPLGVLECKFGGVIQGGSQMLSFSHAYVPKDEPKPPAPQ